MSVLISNDKAMAGIYRAVVLNSYDRSASIYIPALHKNQMPFDTPSNPKGRNSMIVLEDGTIIVNNAPINMKLQDYPIAMTQVPQTNIPLDRGDSVWVTFENGDANFPVIVGQLGSTLSKSKGNYYYKSNSSASYEYNNNISDNTKYTDYIEPSDIQTISGKTTYNGLIRCINGTDAGYETDAGLDVNATFGTPVYSPCDGTFAYSEYGHTPWGVSKFGSDGKDTPYSIGINIGKPFTFAGKQISYIFLTHLSRLVYNLKRGTNQRVKMGEHIGWSGTANNSPHLHIGLSPSNWSPLNMKQTRAVFASEAGLKWKVGE